MEDRELFEEDETECPPVGSQWNKILPWVDSLYVTATQKLTDYLYFLLDCGGGEITRKYFRHAIWSMKVFDRKQQNYGPENIAQLGEDGIMSRVRDDKFSRLKTLLKTPGAAIEGEPALDAWHDTSVYGLLGAMVHVGDWPTKEELGMNTRNFVEICEEAIEMAADPENGFTSADALHYIEENLPK